MLKKQSRHDVKTTLDRLEAALRQKGVSVLARIDHAAAAAGAGLTLRPTQVLIFGNPRLGTPLMQARQEIGLDLPLKVLAWEDEAGRVWMGYEPPQEIARRHDLSGAEGLGRMTAMLETLTGEAAGT